MSVIIDMDKPDGCRGCPFCNGLKCVLHDEWYGNWWEKYAHCPLSNADNVLDDELVVQIAEKEYGAGEWDMFKRITAAYYGKEYYFFQDDGTVYSRDSHKDLSRDDAFDEFIERIRDEG